MPFREIDGLRYWVFDSLEGQAVQHAVFTRQGGVSPAPWQGLNLGGTVGDDPEKVAENRRRAFAALGRPLESNFDVWQVHSADVAYGDAPRPPHQPHARADIILTNRPAVTLFMRFADCVPILLYDPQRRVIGIAHAGWQGTVKRVAQVAVAAMQARYGSRPEDILAAIGPSIAAHHYPIGPEVAAQVRAAFPAWADTLLESPSPDGGVPHPLVVQFDLWAANRLLLEQCGVRHIEVAGLCTACSTGDWFSHRAEHGQTGRFGVLLALR